MARTKSILEFFGSWPCKKELGRIAKELKKERDIFKIDS